MMRCGVEMFDSDEIGRVFLDDKKSTKALRT